MKLKLFVFLFLFSSIYKFLKAEFNPKDTICSNKIVSLNEHFTKKYCDVCGCAINNNSIAIDGILNNKYIGFKYLTQHFKVKENIFINKANEDQYFNSIQFLSKIPLSKKNIFYAIIPYNTNTKGIEEKNRISGIGDITLLTNYYLVNNRFNTKKSAHRVLTNFGLKIPTGKFNVSNSGGVNPGFQLGTGSWDFLTSLNYQYIKEGFAFQAGTDYIFKTENSNNYKFGNQWNSSLTGYYFFKVGKIRINPKIGLISEIFESNKQLQEKIPRTSGNIFLGKAGLEINYKNLTLGNDFALPVYSNLAENDILPISRFSFFISYNL